MGQNSPFRGVHLAGSIKDYIVMVGRCAGMGAVRDPATFAS